MLYGDTGITNPLSPNVESYLKHPPIVLESYLWKSRHSLGMYKV